MKKLLCGILAVMLVFSVLSACGKTENPTTTTTTTATNQDGATTEPEQVKKENLEDYIGYWYVDESLRLANFPDGVDVEVCVTGVIDDGVRYGVSLEVYEGMYGYFSSDYVEVDPETNIACIDVDWDRSDIPIQFKDGTVVYYAGTPFTYLEKVLNNKCEDDLYHSDLLNYNMLEFKERYEETYWYAYNVFDLDYDTLTTPTLDELEMGELHIKKAVVDENWQHKIIFDYSYGGYTAQNVEAVIEYDDRYVCYRARFVTSDGKEGDFRLDRRFSYYDDTMELNIDGERVCVFTGRRFERFDAKAVNYNLSEYVGYWYHFDVTIADAWYAGLTMPEVWVKEVNGNKMTFGYVVLGENSEYKEVVVEIKNNLGVFKMSKGIRADVVIMIGNNSIHIASNHGSGIYSNTFAYQRRYSIDDIRCNL